ncbi:MAG: hypothetical protein BWY28_03066 [bacterium ADurb.Bin236]|nr:MAG: hypothetical protein BWY28_03066 [bacterium ADurb.Bin236]
MFRADSRDSKRPLAGLFSLWGKDRKWELPTPGNLPRSVYPCRGSVALKFRFCRDADQCFDLINKTRQARNGARPCANGAVASIRLSRFIARRDRLVGAGCSGISCYVCFSGDVRGSVHEGRRSPAPSYLSSNATLHSSKVLVLSDLFASSPSSNATLFFDSSEKAPPPPASS